jgi:hypothetical protein
MNPNGYVLLRELPTVWKKVNKENWDSCKLGTIELARVRVDNCAWSDKVVKDAGFTWNWKSAASFESVLDWLK